MRISGGLEGNEMIARDKNDHGSVQDDSPKGPPTDSQQRRKLRRDAPEAHQNAGPRHRDGRPARAEGQHKAAAAKHLQGGPRQG
jgi:hypothetical protein